MDKNRGVFRGMRFDTGEWVKGYYYKKIVYSEESYALSKDLGHMIVDAIETYDPSASHPIQHHTVESATLGECSGQTDKHDRLMFEYDIVHLSHSPVWQTDPELGMVIFHEGSFGILVKRNGEYITYAFHTLSNAVIEIIGNVFDNPEYMEHFKLE